MLIRKLLNTCQFKQNAASFKTLNKKLASFTKHTGSIFWCAKFHLLLHNRYPTDNSGSVNNGQLERARFDGHCYCSTLP